MLTQLSHPYTRCYNSLIPTHANTIVASLHTLTFAVKHLMTNTARNTHPPTHPSTPTPIHPHTPTPTPTHHYSHVLMQWPRLTWLYPTNSPSGSIILKLTIPPWVAMSSKWPLWYNTHTGWLLQCLSWFSSLYTIWARRKVCCDTRSIDCAMLFTALNPWRSARMPRNGSVPCSNLQMVKGQVE